MVDGPPRCAPAAASRAAVLGSRSSRRQLKSLLADAAAAGACSVSCKLARGSLVGFTIHFKCCAANGAKHGDHHTGSPRAGAPTQTVRADVPPAQTATSRVARCAAPPTKAPNTHHVADSCDCEPHAALSSACAAGPALVDAAGSAQPPATAPTPDAARRRRGTRGGVRQRRHSNKRQQFNNKSNNLKSHSHPHLPPASSKPSLPSDALPPPPRPPPPSPAQTQPTSPPHQSPSAIAPCSPAASGKRVREESPPGSLGIPKEHACMQGR